MGLTQTEEKVLRDLVRKVAEIASLGVHKEKARLWQKVNDLESERAVVQFREVPWHELNVNDELTMRIPREHLWAHALEWELRHVIYQWKHMPVDMVVPNYLECPLAISNTKVGMKEDVEILRTHPRSGIVSRHYNPQIVEPADIEKIKMAQVTHDEKASQESLDRMTELLGDIIPIKQVGFKGRFFGPWDLLIRLWGVEQALIDLIERPEMVNAAMTRMVDSGLAELEQMEKLNLLTMNNDHWFMGPAGHSYSNDLPGKDYDPEHVRPHNMWGHAAAQIFSAVSPAMHWEFSLKHEIRWLEHWGLNSYGCCEPLDDKMDILKRIPRLRKVSMSPYISVDRAVAEVQDKYVFSFKPNPSILAGENWHPERARATIREVLEKGRGCHIEIIMKDISTVRREPHRLWEWARMAMEEVEQFAH